MGYQTDFSGLFGVFPQPLGQHQVEYLTKFSQTRRQTYSRNWILENPEPEEVALRQAIGRADPGERGDFYVGELGYSRLIDRDKGGVLDANTPPGGMASFLSVALGATISDKLLPYRYPRERQPGLWCQWIPSVEGDYIEWDQGEKFYDYIEWIEYLIHAFLTPWGRWLEGQVKWRGEDFEDIGVMVATRELEPEARELTRLTVIENAWD